MVALVPLLGLISSLKRSSPARVFSFYLTLTLLTWATLTLFRVWHPRYSLLLWATLPAFAALLWRGKRTRLLYLGYATYLLVGLVLMGGGQHFLKRDLNSMTTEDCQALLGNDPPPVVIAPYPRHATALRRLCANEGMHVLDVPWIRHLPNEATQMKALHSSLKARRPAELGVILGNIRGGSLVTTHQRLHRLLSERCIRTLQRQTGEHLHHDLRQRISRSGEHPNHKARYRFERWRCHWP